jgi:dTDP-4-dehydrorhamnose reductase
MKILVTGKDGQLGLCFKDVFTQSSSLTSSLSSSLPKHQVTFVGRKELDLSSKNSIESFLSKNKFDLIINCAAYTNVEKAEDEVALANQINGHAIKTLALHHAGHIIHFSTDYIFDGSKNSAYTTLDVPCPISSYGASKLFGERMLTEFAHSYSLIRISWVYSSYGKNFVKTIAAASKARPELKVVSDQVGSPTSAHELANWIVANLDQLMHKKQTIHLTDGGEISWFDFAKFIAHHTNPNCQVYPILTQDYKTKAQRPLNSRLFKLFTLPDWQQSTLSVLKKLK